jgi:peptide/nickel transport system permease protein
LPSGSARISTISSLYVGKGVGVIVMILSFVGKRALLSLITLAILSVVVFLGGQLLPGDVGRAVLGPLADARSVAAFDHLVGVDRPLPVQYWSWITHLLTGDMGNSFTFRAPVAPFVADALIHSMKLAALAFVLVVPLGIAGGVVAALGAGTWLDRGLTLLGQSLGIVPEFISSIVLILVFGVWLRWLPMSADWPEGAGFVTQIRYLILPSVPLVLIFFGYIARVARVGTIEALDADYTRTAILKGLPWLTVMRRHVLRNALLPTITVTASLVGYLAGGLVVIETLFHYRGIGGLIYTAARAKDFPMLEAGVLAVGAVYAIASLLGDLLSSALNPRTRTDRA